MAKLIIIAAIGQNNELGKNNNLIWKLKGDLKFFKDTTMSHKIVMGYNTFKSLPNLLPGREHIILTHKDLKIEGVKIFNNFDSLLIFLKTLDEDVFIIGGESIYKLFINYADELLLTEIQANCIDADAYFPNFNKEEFTQEILKETVNEEISYKHVRYRRVK